MKSSTITTNFLTGKHSHFSHLLLEWFDQYGRKHLPWQLNKTPYRVWISEIMLQQTQVATVIPYFERFMQHFPHLDRLAQAPEDQVLHLWAGLGYYSRARNLHRAAKMIFRENAGIFPNQFEDLKKLPGIGDSTASAILALAFHQHATILDGNVKRVLARFHGMSEPINEKSTEAILWSYAKQHTPLERIADYTQAIMDLGALVCTPRKPQCIKCPMGSICTARELNLTDVLPQKKAKTKIPIRSATFIIVQHGRSVWLNKRPAQGIWGGLWSLPELAGEPEKKRLQIFCKEKLQLKLSHFTSLQPLRHTFTHFHLDIHPILLNVKKASTLIKSDQGIWYNLKQPQTIGLPKPIVTILKSLYVS